MSKTYGFAVIGAGAISAAHIDSIEKIPAARLVGVWSRTPEKAKAVADRHGCEWEEDIESLVERSDVDVVVISTASGYHMEPAVAAARAGKHLVIEKPLEVTLDRCDAIIEAAQEGGVKLACIFQSRFAPANALVHRAAKEGRFGRLVVGDAYVKWHRPQSYYDQGAWRGTWALDGGGALMNQSIHQVDLLQWIMGPVESVFAHAECLAHEGIEVEDTSAAVLRFSSGALGVIEGTTSIFPGYPKRLEIHGNQGGAVLVDDALTSWHAKDESETEQQKVLEAYGPRDASGTFSDPMALSFEKHRGQIEDLLEAVEAGRDPVVDGIEGRKAVAVIRAIYDSAASGRPVQPSF